MVVPHTQTGYGDICICPIFGGYSYYLGLSSAREPPIKVVYYPRRFRYERGGLSGRTSWCCASRLTRKEHIKKAVRITLVCLDKCLTFQ